MIALDATYSLDPSPSGVAVYSREILYGLARAHPQTEFAFCYRPHRFRASRMAPLPPNARRRLLAPGFGLFHGLNQRLPRWWAGPKIATFHDLFVMTGEYSTPEFRARFAEQAREAAKRATVIIAVSEFTRGQVISLLGVDPSRVRVIHHGVRALPTCCNPGAREDHPERRRNPERGRTSHGWWKHSKLIDPSWRLVLIGSNGYGAECDSRPHRSQSRPRAHCSPRICPSGGLAAWYARAQVFAFPSLDEGFGMPVLEAMAAGAPVLTSNRSALPEVAGDAALLMDPENLDSLTDGLQRVTR